MGLFSSNSKKTVEQLRRENKSKDQEIFRLKKLCAEKDSYFTEMISDGMRHGSPLAAKHMADRKQFLKGK